MFGENEFEFEELALAKKLGLGAQKAEQIDFELWDTEQIAAAGTTQLRFFSTPMGATKTKLATNLISAGRIPMGNWFKCMGFGFGLKDNAAAPLPVDEAREIVYGAYLEFKINEVEYFSALISTLPFGGGLFYSGDIDAAAAATGENVFSSGVPAAGSFRKLLKPIYVPRNTDFTLTVNWPTAPTPTAAIDAIIRMRGLLARPARS